MSFNAFQMQMGLNYKIQFINNPIQPVKLSKERNKNLFQAHHMIQGFPVFTTSNLSETSVMSVSTAECRHINTF